VYLILVKMSPGNLLEVIPADLLDTVYQLSCTLYSTQVWLYVWTTDQVLAMFSILQRFK